MHLEEFCSNFYNLIKKKEKGASFFQDAQAQLSGLLADTQWFLDFLEKLVLDTSFCQQQKPSRWLNEYTVYRSPEGSFVILAYIWEPRQVDVIHDHNSWGIVGTLSGKVRETKYRRIDDGGKDGYAELEETLNKIIDPCETTYVLPLDKGIHKLENFDGHTITIHVYGKSVRKGFLNYYDSENRTVTRTYVYSLHRAALALRTLGDMKSPASRKILQEAMKLSEEEILKKEIELSLMRSDAN